jgi:hypothetical protein
MVKCCFPNQIVDGYCFSPQPKYWNINKKWKISKSFK